MRKLLTMTEIKKLYDSEWVLIVDPDTDEELNVLGGEVEFHSKDRDAVWQKAQDLKPVRCAVLYAGERPWKRVVV